MIEAPCEPAKAEAAVAKDLSDLLVKIETMKERLREAECKRQEVHRPATPTV